MDYNDFVDYIKSDGCRVYVYNNKESIHYGNKGTFDYNEKGPIICVANKGLIGHKKIEILIHEYGHYLQYKDGFLQYLDSICDAYEIEDKWLNKKIELNEFELKIVRNMILTIEYDAEKRGFDAANFLRPVHYSPQLYLKGAAAYVAAIKWSFATRKKTNNTPARRLFKSKILTNKEIFEDLTEKEISVLGESLKEKKDGF